MQVMDNAKWTFHLSLDAQIYNTETISYDYVVDIVMWQ